MVVNNDEWNSKGKMVDSHSLKFGVDRILSEEICSKNSVGSSKTTIPPCATCLSSFYRCCSLTPVLGLTCFYRQGIQMPQGGVRAFGNVLIPQESGVGINNLQSNSSETGSKRKRSWSRAVFSNLQRKGLEKRFQLQKYITKPDRRQLAATLGLTDAQVKVWFQNRRMKWRHTKESARQDSGAKSTEEESSFVNVNESNQIQKTDSDCESDVDVQTVDT